MVSSLFGLSPDKFVIYFEFCVLGFCFVFTSDGGNGRCICMRIYTRMDGMKVWVIAKLSMSLGTVYVLEYIYG